MNCLVTGGAGFIGSHLVDVLVAEGNNVVVIDSLISGKKSNLVDVWDKIQFVQVDITRDDISDFFVGCDVVFHLAALADIVPSIVDPVGYVTTNVLGTLRVLEAVRKHNVPRVVYAASSSCYGLADEVPTKETSPIQPTYPYALSKWMGEELVMHWGELYKIDVLSLRLFNVYGPRARTSGNYGAVLGLFFAQHLADLPLTVVGDGTQTRDFIYVQDVGAFFVGRHDQIICITGDGGLQINIQELATIQRHAIPLKIFVMNNHGHGIIQGTQDQWLNGSHVASSESGGLPDPDFASIFRAYGIHTIVCVDNSSIDVAIDEILKVEGPIACIVDMQTGPQIYPKLLAGKAIHESFPPVTEVELSTAMRF